MVRRPQRSSIIEPIRELDEIKIIDGNTSSGSFNFLIDSIPLSGSDFEDEFTGFILNEATSRLYSGFRHEPSGRTVINTSTGSILDTKKFEIDAMAGRGAGYEKLDQLVMELLLGVRG